uniref:Ribonuclease H protein At1g65750 family n=1 Tax=Cajanus cajan TaxID=3821 RepID=A0A151QPY6_CAJCA|nr:Putative ribonuclease H protein At1g65750 family [Cajanus cajan]
MMSEVERSNRFFGVKMGTQQVSVSISQYADDAIFFGEASLENVVAIKSILRCFELVSGLKVNFVKSKKLSLNLAPPIYYMSFFKVPRAVSRLITSMQRWLLWGSKNEQRKICWIKWDRVTLPKSKGGLGVKDIDSFNKALLAK